MDIENIETHGQAGIEFTDRTGTPCILWILENIKDLRFDLDTDFSQFSQEDIKILLPYLEAYVNSGTLQLHTFLPLQKLMMNWADLIANYTPYASGWGKDAWDGWHDRLNRETEQALTGLPNTDDYVAQIKALQQIVKTWIEPQRSPLQEEEIDPRDTQIAYAAVIEDPKKRIERLLKLFQNQEDELSTMQEAGIAMVANIADQGRRIEELEKGKAYYMRQCDQYVDRVADLEELLEEWKKYGQPSFDSRSPDELIHLTEQLLGEGQ